MTWCHSTKINELCGFSQRQYSCGYDISFIHAVLSRSSCPFSLQHYLSFCSSGPASSLVKDVNVLVGEGRAYKFRSSGSNLQWLKFVVSQKDCKQRLELEGGEETTGAGVPSVTKPQLRWTR